MDMSGYSTEFLPAGKKKGVKTDSESKIFTRELCIMVIYKRKHSLASSDSDFLTF